MKSYPKSYIYYKRQRTTVNSTKCVGGHALNTMNLTYLRTRNWHKYKVCTLKFEVFAPRSNIQLLKCFLWDPALSHRPWILVYWKHTPITEQYETLIMLYGSAVITFSSHFLKCIFLIAILLVAHTFLLDKLFYWKSAKFI